MEKASLFEGVFADKRLGAGSERIFERFVNGQFSVLHQALPGPAAYSDRTNTIPDSQCLVHPERCV